MIVDSSGILGILLGEPEAKALSTLMIGAEKPAIPAPAYVEIGLRMCRLPQANEAIAKLTGFLTDVGAVIEPFFAEDAPVALEAFQRFGKGQGHPAQLNFGDCLVYAIARRLDRPLLCLGNDFAATDLALVPLTTD